MNTTISYYKELFKKHFFSFFIIFILFFTLFVLYAYYSPKVYLSEGTVEVIKYKQNSIQDQNQLQIAIKESSPEDEAEILKSNLLINKAIKELGLEYEFFINTDQKTFAVNKEDIPFIISTFELKEKSLYNKQINIHQIDENSYQISFDTSSMLSKIKGSANGIRIEETYKFGKLIKNRLFNIKVDKKEGL